MARRIVLTPPAESPEATTWRDHLDQLSALVQQARPATAQNAWFAPTAAEAAYHVLDQYRSAGTPGFDAEVPVEIRDQHLSLTRLKDA
ncbi:MAG: hypothetical protein ABW110_14325 [Steroidobacteraceae bacterium]